MYKRDVQIRAQKEENQTKLIKLGAKWKLAVKRSKVTARCAHGIQSGF